MAEEIVGKTEAGDGAGDVWAEIDLSAIRHNVKQLRSILTPGTRLMIVVKANAYGHGIVPVARQALAAGADYLGVARYPEALCLRQAGIRAPILIFGYTPPEFTCELLAHNLIQTVYSYQTAGQMAGQAGHSDNPLPVHVKVDTGMGRLGVMAAAPGSENGSGEEGVNQAALDEIAAIKNLPGLRVEGLYTHFATADHQDKRFARRQFARFQRLKSALADAGITFDLCHAANSAAIIDMPETHMDMVRAGISVYGLYPSDQVSRTRMALKPAMTLKSRIIHLKTVGAGFPVSYGATAETKAPTTIATVSIGYADGYNRLLSSKGRMLVRGQSAPVIGRVCMDQSMLDVGHIANVEMGDEVVAFGPDDTGGLPVAEVADQLGTITYEVVTGVSDRVERRYPERRR
ncbi:MAG: alanine racemase [Desulfobacterales bacterium]|nr:alanine racemase [Desulfobacterales bacterium]